MFSTKAHIFAQAKGLYEKSRCTLSQFCFCMSHPQNLEDSDTRSDDFNTPSYKGKMLVVISTLQKKARNHLQVEMLEKT